MSKDKPPPPPMIISHGGRAMGGHEHNEGDPCPICDAAPKPPAKVIPFGGITKLDISPALVLDKAKERGMEGVVVLGFDKDGDEYIASSYADGGTVLWLLERCKALLMES